MNTYRYVVYMVMDFLKNASDDAYYTTDHVIFLLNKFRAYVLKNKYDESTQAPLDSNYQSLTLTLEETDRVEGFPCKGEYLRTKKPLPSKLGVGKCDVYGADFFVPQFTWVTPQRFRFVGHNKWFGNTVYVAKGADDRLYLKSCNTQIYYLEKLNVRGIFEDPIEVAKMNGLACEPLDVEFPLEDNLLPLVMQYVVKELSGGLYKPQDTTNNASDDLSTIAQFIRQYAKSPLRNMIDGND